MYQGSQGQGRSELVGLEDILKLGLKELVQHLDFWIRHTAEFARQRVYRGCAVSGPRGTMRDAGILRWCHMS
jgi:hypothetical protein